MGNHHLLTKTDMTFVEWLTYGIEQNWIGPPVCSTHDGIPTSEWEDNQYENSDDICLHILRLYEDEVHRISIEDNHPPSIWRKTGWEQK